MLKKDESCFASDAVPLLMQVLMDDAQVDVVEVVRHVFFYALTRVMTRRAPT